MSLVTTRVLYKEHIRGMVGYPYWTVIPLCAKVNGKGSVYMERDETRKKMLELQRSEIELVSERAKFWLYLDAKLKDLDDAKFKLVFTALHHRRIRTEDALMKAIEFLKDGGHIRGIGPVIKEILLSVNV